MYEPSYKFSDQSLACLETCDRRLIHLFMRIIENRDCTILCGHRGQQEQDRLYRESKTMVLFPDSEHNRTPSFAVDVAPYPIDWDDLMRFYFFGGYVKAIADHMKIPIRWGGDWDGDGNLKDQRFNDLVHFELKEV